jgi:hypothetical protein
VVEQYGIKRAEKLSNSLPFLFREYPGFVVSALNNVEKNVLELSRKQRFDMAANLCLEWTPRVRDALFYFHRYYRRSLGIAISSLFIFWNILLYAIFSSSSAKTDIWIPSHLFKGLLVVEFLLGVYQKWPIMHLIYVTLPIYVASLIVNVLDLTPKRALEGLMNLRHKLTVQFFAYILCSGRSHSNSGK